jgi:RNA polymerase sigma-70 factor (ECF subfamily)
VPSTQEKFERIVMPEAPRLLRFARRLTGDPHAAEDLVQETLYHAWRGFRQFKECGNPRAWVFRILVNAFYGQARKARPASEVLKEPASNPTVQQRLEIEQALDALPEEHRTVLLLGVVEGFTCREVSEILSIPIGTVMSRLSRARQALREQLREKAIR